MSQIPEDVRIRVRAQANNQCGYCRSFQRYVLGVLEIEHIIPKAAGGFDDEEIYGSPVVCAIPTKAHKLTLKSQ